MLSLLQDSKASLEAVPDPEWSALAALDRGKPEEALSILMREYGNGVFRYCRQMLGSDDLAEEVQQLTFVQAYEGLAKFARRSSLKTWLFGIARHRCLDFAKTNRRRLRRFGPLEEAPPDVAAPGASVEDRLAAGARARVLESCLQTLGPRVRDAVVLRFQQGLSYPDIARLSGEKAPALQIRVARALPVLRRCMEEKGMAP
jgi:RNA polymerase sigma-70 factor, ECF subfamily